jgi:hypothetical protein
LAVETCPTKFALEIYPAEPRPITVEVNWEAKYVVETRVARLAVETWPTRLALEIYPAEPRPITVEVN